MTPPTMTPMVMSMMLLMVMTPMMTLVMTLIDTLLITTPILQHLQTLDHFEETILSAVKPINGSA